MHNTSNLTATQDRPPTPLAPIFENMPAELQARRQWVVWQYEWRDGRWTKVPYNPRTGLKAETDNPVTWSSFEEVRAAYERGGWAGVGFVLSADDPYFGGDFDKCRDKDTGQVDEGKMFALARMSTYSEWSPSSIGLRFIGRGKLPPAGRVNRAQGVELYDAGRFLTLTGHLVEGMPAVIEDRQREVEELHQEVFPQKAQRRRDGNAAPEDRGIGSLTDDEIIERAMKAKNGENFRRLFEGNTSGYPSPSEADLALCSQIAFWTGPDAQWIDSIFRRSQLMRDKWKEKHFRNGQTYGEATIAKALDDKVEFYSAPTKRSDPAPDDEIAVAGGVSLRPGRPHQTKSGKVTVGVSVVKAGAIADHLPVTSAPSNRKAAAQAIARHVGTQDAGTCAKIDDAIARLIAQAVKQLSAPRAGAEYMIRDIVAERVPPAFGLAYRTARGVWAERGKTEKTRAEIVTFVPDWLIEACAEADDAPRNDDNTVNRHALIRVVKAELEVLWSSLVETLPAQADAKLDQDSGAAKKFWSSMFRLWTRPGTHEIAKTVVGTGGEVTAAKASMISRVRSQATKEGYLGGGATPGRREPWRQVQAAHSAWWRPQLKNGERLIRLGMRWELQEAVNVWLPGPVEDQDSLSRLCEQYGVADPNPGVPCRMSGGDRLVVLSVDFTSKLLSLPEEPIEFPVPAGVAQSPSLSPDEGKRLIELIGKERSEELTLDEQDEVIDLVRKTGNTRLADKAREFFDAELKGFE